MDGRQLNRFELTQKAQRVQMSASEADRGFTVVLPWATAVEQVDGAEVVSRADRGQRLPGDPPGGIVLRATRPRIAFTWS